MKAVGNTSAFHANPAENVGFGRSWLYGRAAPDLYGLMLWGRTDREDAEALVRFLVGELAPEVEPHRSLIDAARLDGVDGEAFAVLGDYVQRRRDDLSRAVTKLALVRPAGIAGATVAGFYAVQGAPYPTDVFESVTDALAWLGADDHAVWFDELAATQLTLTSTDPLLASLRAAALTDVVDFDLAAAARALALSERTLQRRLKQLGTTFGAELAAARIDEAKRRMLESDAPLTRIALDVGLSTPQRFSSLFSERVGMSPSEWRAAQKKSNG